MTHNFYLCLQTWKTVFKLDKTYCHKSNLFWIVSTKVSSLENCDTYPLHGTLQNLSGVYDGTLCCAIYFSITCNYLSNIVRVWHSRNSVPNLFVNLFCPEDLEIWPFYFSTCALNISGSVFWHSILLLHPIEIYFKCLTGVVDFVSKKNQISP